jgi:hypothetical protein
MQHAAFRVHLVEFHPAGLRHAQAMPEHQEQQATLAHLVPAALGRFNQPFNLAAGEVFDAPETRVNRGGDFSNIYKMFHFVDSSRRGSNDRAIVPVLRSRPDACRVGDQSFRSGDVAEHYRIVLEIRGW